MFSINAIEIKGVRVIEVVGRMDGETSLDVGRALDEALAQGHRQLVLDLGSVEYMSSPGLREIVRVFKSAQRQNGDLRLANPSERVMDVLQLAGLDQVLDVYTTQQKAIDSF